MMPRERTYLERLVNCAILIVLLFILFSYLGA